MFDRQQRRRANAHSRQIQQQTIGTHVSHESMNAKRTKVHFGDRRRQKKAVQGEISYVVPSASTRESAADFSRRSKTRDYVQTTYRTIRRKRLLLFVAVACAAVMVVSGVTAFVYKTSVGYKMALHDHGVTEQLAKVEAPTDAYWVLLAGEYDASGKDYDGPHLLELMYVDPANAKISFLAVPPTIPVSLSDGSVHPLSQAQTVDGDKGLVRKVQDVTGARIAHFVKVNREGFIALVDALGGVEVTLSEEIDDPRAGTVFLPAGLQTLDGEAAFVAMRAANYTDPLATQAKTQAAVSEAILQKILDLGGLTSIATFDQIAADFKTDLTFDEMSGLLAPFSAAGTFATQAAVVPGYETIDRGIEIYVVFASELSSLMQTITSGGDIYQKEAAPDVDKGKIKVTVRNGSTVVGAAASAASALSGAGFKAEADGNTDSPIYSETLVIYKTSENEDAAKSVAQTLGQGRVTGAGTYYVFDSDVLVVIGANWTS